MRVSGITLWAHELEMAVPYAYSGGELTHATTLILRLTTDTGLEGWGESCPLGPTYQPAHALGGIAAVQEMAPALLGQRALPRTLHAAMDGALNGHNYAKALVDIAAWDVLGKAADQPIHTLLGGPFADEIPSYFAVRPSTPQEAQNEVRRRVAEGYKAIQLKIGTGDLQADIACIRAVFEVLPSNVSLAADANRKLLVEDAIHMSRALADVSFALEQPCNTTEEMRQLKGRLNHPVYWDESTTEPAVVLDALGQGHADGFGMKLTRVGGISGTCAVRDMAIARGAKISIDDSWGGDIIAAACVHVGATVPGRLFRGTWLAQPFIGKGYDPIGHVRVDAGQIKVPQGPGLGLNIDAAQFGQPILEVS